jgi:hypothetical protein
MKPIAAAPNHERLVERGPQRTDEVRHGRFRSNEQEIGPCRAGEIQIAGGRFRGAAIPGMSHRRQRRTGAVVGACKSK